MSTSTRPPASGDPNLVREALDALLEIAWEGQPPEVTDALRAQASELSEEERRQLLGGFVDQRVLVELLRKAAEGQADDVDTVPMDEQQTQMVDAALHPLTRLLEPQATEALDNLEPGQRANLLFSAVHRRG